MKAATGKSHASILVASDSATEAELVKSLLEDDFDNTTVSVNPDKVGEDFQRCRPDVLLLAFRELQRSEDYYLALYRLGGKSPPQRHRAVILCTKEDVRQAYNLCRRALFDDYVLFWPVNHDVTRLLMSVHNALDALATTTDDLPSVAAFAAQARGLSESETALSQQLARAQDYIASTGRAVARAEQNIGTALDGLSVRLRAGALEPSGPDSPAELAGAIARLGSDAVLPQLRTVSESLQPLTQWADNVQQAVTPHLQSARALGALAARIRPTILVVDDDEFQHRLIARLLESEPYQLKFVLGGSEALNALCRMRPDAILMDLVMPDMNGLDLTRRLKSDPKTIDIPVIMVTGNSEKKTVLDSVQAGVADYVVKPFDRQSLVTKLARVLRA